MLNFELFKRELIFNFPAKTSRGAISKKDCFLIKVYNIDNPEAFGWGECNYLKGLSIDDYSDYEVRLKSILKKCSGNLNTISELNEYVDQEKYPSIYFGLETALLDLSNGGQKIIYNNSFIKGTSIPINGLVWMGDKSFMKEQIDNKLEKGFDCIKIKVGALNFDDELDLLKYIRSEYSSDDITLRVDANGAFKVNEALEKLDKLSQLHLHSIEQPIWAGQLEEMAKLCENTPIPIALDEELIGVSKEQKLHLLTQLKPQYIILKPALLGGLSACEEWIKYAEDQDIPWWMTSALEANIGLNAIAQFTANYKIDKPHGLGTGQLYHNNINSSLEINDGELSYNHHKSWEI